MPTGRRAGRDQTAPIVSGGRSARARAGAVVLGLGALLAATVLTGSGAGAVDVDPSTGDEGGHGVGPVGPGNARVASARVSPAAGPDFEMPFRCGSSWTGSTRSGHSPSYYAVDFNAPDDFNQPVLASARGVVVRAERTTTGYGRYVVVDHGGGYTTLYAHLNDFVVSVGEVLDQGDQVGYLGTTGGSTGPHLHFEERLNGAYFPPYFHRTTWQFGTTRGSASCADSPIIGDWDGRGGVDVGVFRATPTSSEFRRVTPPASGMREWWYRYGYAIDRPVVGDWDGDGRTEGGIHRLGVASFKLRNVDRTTTSVAVGRPTDQPVTGDWSGDGRTEVGVYVPAVRDFVLRGSDGKDDRVDYGKPGSQPVVGDWNADGADDVGLFDPMTDRWMLRKVLASGRVVSALITFGRPGDLPVTGDWNGDGRTDLGVWDPDTATFSLRYWRNGVLEVDTQVFGRTR